MSEATPPHPVTPTPHTTPGRPRLLILSSHAIQYQAPLLRAMAQDPRFSIKVALCSDQGARSYQDEGFGQQVKWDIPLLQGYDHEVLRNWSPVPNPSRFWGLMNPGIVPKIWSGEFDALMIQSWANATTWIAIVAASLRGLPMILKAEANIYWPTHPWKAGIKRLVLANLFRRMHSILATGRYGVEFFRHYQVPPEKIAVAPYAVDNDFFIAQAEALAPKRAALRRQSSVPENVPLIVYVGKLSRRKRPFDLLEAFAEVRKQSPAALVFVGDGELRPSMEAWVKEHAVPDVHFAGFRNQTELPGFLAAADIFVLPSTALETWGLVVNEAMCFSLPVIVTDRVGAGGDLVCEGKNGYVYPVGDVGQLAQRLRMLVQDPSLRHAMGQESFRMIKKWSYREGIDVIASTLEHLKGN